MTSSPPKKRKVKSCRSAALKYRRRGWAPVPVHPRDKRPVGDAWQKLRLSEKDIPSYFKDGQNVGVLLGEPSGGLVDIDLDCEEALALAEVFLPPTDSVFGRKSTPASHWLYVADPLPGTERFKDTDGEVLVEVRSTGGQTVFPSSTHPSGELIAWVHDGDPAEIDGPTLRSRVARLAAAAILVRHWPAEGSRQDVALALAGGLLRGGWEEEEASEFIGIVAEVAGDEETVKRAKAAEYTARSLGHDRPVTGWPRLTQLLGKEVTHRLREWLGVRGGSLQNDGFPQVVVTNRPLREVAEDALCALEGANEPTELFVRSGSLARVRADERGRPLIERLDQSHLRGRLARVADFMRIDKQGGRRHTSPPPEVVKDVLSLGSWPFPALEGVVEVPVLRPDGSVIDTPGYDSATCLLYLPSPELVVPAVPTTPTGRDVAQALALIDEAIADFPFVDEASFANARALILTPFLLPAISGSVPLALIDKPRAGTGASLLAEVVTRIATGRPAAMMTAPRDEEEWRKKITSLLSEGATVTVIDNVVNRLSSSSLSAVLTSRVWKDRILGQSEMVTFPQRSTWIATGNNIRLGADMPRRSYWIRLDAIVARPWERAGFRHPDLLGWVTENRGRLVGAILTLARAWFAAGCNESVVPVLGGFESWARTVGRTLAFCGVDGFLGNQRRLYEEADEDGAQWTAFFAAWWRLYGDRPVIVAELAKNAGDLRSALPDELAEAQGASEDSFRRRLGKALAKHADVVFGDFRLERAGMDEHLKVVLWRLRGCGVSRVSSPTPTNKKNLNGKKKGQKQTRQTRRTRKTATQQDGEKVSVSL